MNYRRSSCAIPFSISEIPTEGKAVLINREQGYSISSKDDKKMVSYLESFLNTNQTEASKSGIDTVYSDGKQYMLAYGSSKILGMDLVIYEPCQQRPCAFDRL